MAGTIRTWTPVADRTLAADLGSLPAFDPGDGELATRKAHGRALNAVAADIRELLAGDGIAARVVSLPSWELFRLRPDDQRQRLLPAELPTVAVEAGVAQGWCEFADAVVGLDRFGVSAPGPDAFEHLGITPEAVADRVRRQLGAGSFRRGRQR